MKIPPYVLGLLGGALLATTAGAAGRAAAITADENARPRVIALSDIGNEPDDSESMVRFLLYTNEFDVEALIASTSTWQRPAVHPEMIEERVEAYGRVLNNLKVHATGISRGKLPLTRYRRAILTVPTAGTAAAEALGCKQTAER
jgi:hypothetical protein